MTLPILATLAVFAADTPDATVLRGIRLIGPSTFRARPAGRTRTTVTVERDVIDNDRLPKDREPALVVQSLPHLHHAALIGRR